MKKQRSRRPVLRVSAVLVAALALVPAAIAAGGGKLQGEFTAEVQATKASFPVDKTPVERAYEFECLNRKCSSVRFKREGGDGVYKSKLSEERDGVFTGTERFDDDGCPDSDANGRREIEHEVTIKKVKSGKVKKIAGTSNYAWPQCEGDPTQTTKFTAVPK